MSARTLNLDDHLYSYLLEHSVRESDLLRRLREETQAQTEYAMMQISPEQGQFMALMTQISGARRAIEIGTFTGYSAICVAQAMPEDGRLIACDLSEDWTNMAKRYWREAGVAEKIELRLGPAVATLDDLLKDDAAQGSFDLAFIDADKTGYDAYYERCLKLLRPGGVVLLDNMLWGGSVANPAKDDDDTCAIRALNDKICRDDRVDGSLLPLGDGLWVVRKRH